jgi:hypothetical protein
MAVEDVWQEVYFTGPKDAPAFYFWLDLRNIPHEATYLIHQQAMRALIYHAHDERGAVRPLVRNALQAIAHLTELRLSRPFGWANATQYFVQAAIDPSDGEEAIEGDRARFLTIAMEYAREADTAVAVVWANALEGFRREPRTEPPDRA